MRSVDTETEFKTNGRIWKIKVFCVVPQLKTENITFQGEGKTNNRHLERLPPIDDLAFGGLDSFSSPDDLSDGGCFADSPPSSTSSESTDYRSSSESEQRRDSTSSCANRSSGI